MRSAMPSTIAVLPTPGSPISTGLFLVRRDSTCIERRISSSRPMTGSSLPLRASSVRSRVYFASAWYFPSASGSVTRCVPRTSASAFSSASLRTPASLSARLAAPKSLADEREQQVLAGDVLVLELLRLPGRLLEQVVEPAARRRRRRRRRAPGAGRPAPRPPTGGPPPGRRPACAGWRPRCRPAGRAARRARARASAPGGARLAASSCAACSASCALMVSLSSRIVVPVDEAKHRRQRDKSRGRGRVARTVEARERGGPTQRFEVDWLGCRIWSSRASTGRSASRSWSARSTSRGR